VGALISYGDVGVWVTNDERDAFLDWFADNRCTPSDPRWEWCKCAGQRWLGRCIDLSQLLRPGELLSLTADESSRAAATFWPDVAKLLGIIDAITRGEWTIRPDTIEAIRWRGQPEEPLVEP
jgi:hypothetical protein